MIASAAVALALAACGGNTPTSGVVVTVFGTLSDADVDDVAASMVEFERATGVTVRYIASSNFEADLVERLRRGDPPDLALLPQPGLLDTLVDDGFALAWDGPLTEPAIDGVTPELADLVTFRGDVYGAWYQLTLKSLVWYSPRVFAERGLDVPTSWDELDTMTAELSAGGTTPWCIGIRADGATGWVATDWVEDIVLRFDGPDVYDDWVRHRVLFSDREIVDAVERFGAIALSPTMVAGGNRAAVELTLTESARQLITPDAPCVLHRQASFLPRLLAADIAADDVDIAPDGDLWAFPLPAVGGGPAPLVVGGSVVVRFSDDDAVDRLAEYLTTDDAAARRADRGGFVSARSTFDIERYTFELDRHVAELVRNAEVVRFDASDRMPPEVGVGTFWTAMTSWLGGARLSAVLADVDASWPMVATKPAIPPSGQLSTEAAEDDDD